MKKDLKVGDKIKSPDFPEWNGSVITEILDINCWPITAIAPEGTAYAGQEGAFAWKEVEKLDE